MKILFICTHNRCRSILSEAITNKIAGQLIQAKSAGSETCPLYFSSSVKVYWGLSDPSKIEGSEEEIKAVFLACIDEIAQRATQLKDLASQNVTGDSHKAALSQIGAR